MLETLVADALFDPDDTTKRAALADWLEKDGQRSRARLIRHQLAGEDEAATALERRSRKRWLGPLDQWASRFPRAFERGMLRKLRIKIGEFIKKTTQQTLLAHLPAHGVEWLDLEGASKRPNKIAESAVLAWAYGLSWSKSKADDDALAALGFSPHLSRLGRLSLDDVDAGDAGLAALAERSGLPSLRALALGPSPQRGGKFTAAGVLQLLDDAGLPALEDLSIGNAWEFHVEDFVAGGSRLGRLTRLAIYSRHSFEPIARCGELTNLRELRFNSYEPYSKPEHFWALLDNPAYAKLERFDCSLSRDQPFPDDLRDALRARFAPPHGPGSVLSKVWPEYGGG